jgi:mono/diheme cytochrome c family protein
MNPNLVAGANILKTDGRAIIHSLAKSCIACLLLVPLSIAQDSKLDKAPQSAKRQKNPYASHPDAVAVGNKLFVTNCSQCHGADAKGTGAVPSLVKGPTQSASAGTLFWFITNGSPNDGMPAWVDLPAEQRWQIVTYLKSLGSGKTTSPQRANP